MPRPTLKEMALLVAANLNLVVPPVWEPHRLVGQNFDLIIPAMHQRGFEFHLSTTLTETTPRQVVLEAYFHKEGQKDFKVTSGLEFTFAALILRAAYCALYVEAAGQAVAR